MLGAAYRAGLGLLTALLTLLGVMLARALMRMMVAAARNGTGREHRGSDRNSSDSPGASSLSCQSSRLQPAWASLAPMPAPAAMLAGDSGGYAGGRRRLVIGSRF